MQPSRIQKDAEVLIDSSIVIVVGAHPRAEVNDRPIAYHLFEQISEWISRHKLSATLQPLVVSDVWFLNSEDLRSRPTICIGAPGVNALSAYLADKLTPVFTIQDTLAVHMDLDFADFVALCWGSNHHQTAESVELFIERYLDTFMHRITSAARDEAA